MMDPLKTPRTRSPSLTSLCFHLILPEHPAHPRPSPKICWVRLCPDPSVKGETGVAAAPNTGDVPHLELLEMPHTTAGGGPSSQGRVRLGHLPPCPGNPSPPHPAAPIPATLHSHPSGVSTSKHLKNQRKGRKETSRPRPKTQPAPTRAPLHSTLPGGIKKKKQPGMKYKPKAENTGRPLMETSRTLPAARAVGIAFGDTNDNELRSLHLHSPLIGSQLSE